MRAPRCPRPPSLRGREPFAALRVRGRGGYPAESLYIRRKYALAARATNSPLRGLNAIRSKGRMLFLTRRTVRAPPVP